ncbi:hypothetical protein GCM10027040_30600 [Halomonas shantousis]
MFISALERLQEDHRGYDGLLCLLDRQLPGARRGDMPSIVLLRDILGYMTRHAERTHHAFEQRPYECPGWEPAMGSLSSVYQAGVTA